MNVSIGLDYSSFCNHYYAEAEKMADITVAGYVKKYGPLSRYIDAELVKVKEAKQLSFLEVKCAIGAREDLGRPTTTAMDNKRNFMKFLQER